MLCHAEVSKVQMKATTDRPRYKMRLNDSKNHAIVMTSGGDVGLFESGAIAKGSFIKAVSMMVTNHGNKRCEGVVARMLPWVVHGFNSWRGLNPLVHVVYSHTMS